MVTRRLSDYSTVFVEENIFIGHKDGFQILVLRWFTDLHVCAYVLFFQTHTTEVDLCGGRCKKYAIINKM